MLALRAGVRVSAETRETQLGLVLSFPLAELGARGHGRAPRPSTRLAAPSAPQRAKQVPATEPDHEEPAAGTPAPEEPEQARAELPADLVLDSKLVARLLRRALALDGSQRRGRRLASLRDRSKSSAWLPELSLRAGRSTDQSLRLTPTSSDPYRYTQSDGSDVYGEVKLSWKLDRVLFSREELVVQRLAQSEQARRDQVAERLLNAVFEWQLAELRSRDPAQTLEDQLRFRLLAAQARLRLNVITGGLFERLAPTPAPAPEGREKEPEQ